ncbi:MAG: SCO family protein [Acidobacteria bacterium]|nr:SCO family protein [Acidobacteriota bacterium]
MGSRLFVALSLMPLAALAQSSRQPPGGQLEILKQVAFEQKLNAQLPLDLDFRDQTGSTVPLRRYFGDKPVVLVPVYYDCPMLCNLTMNGLVKTMRALSLDVGKDFHVVMFSIDPKETPQLAAERREVYLKRYDRRGAETGWHFLTGDQPSIQSLTDAIGFRYAYDPTIRQYAHAAGFLVATPQGRVSRYLFGIEYSIKDLRLGLIESSEGRIGDPVGQLLLLCFHYDPTSGKYTMGVLTAVRAAGVLTLSLIGGFLIVSFRRERHRI